MYLHGVLHRYETTNRRSLRVSATLTRVARKEIRIVKNVISSNIYEKNLSAIYKLFAKLLLREDTLQQSFTLSSVCLLPQHHVGVSGS